MWMSWFQSCSITCKGSKTPCLRTVAWTIQESRIGSWPPIRPTQPRIHLASLNKWVDNMGQLYQRFKMEGDPLTTQTEQRLMQRRRFSVRYSPCLKTSLEPCSQEFLCMCVAFGPRHHRLDTSRNPGHKLWYWSWRLTTSCLVWCLSDIFPVGACTQ